MKMEDFSIETSNVILYTFALVSPLLKYPHILVYRGPIVPSIVPTTEDHIVMATVLFLMRIHVHPHTHTHTPRRLVLHYTLCTFFLVYLRK